MNMRTVLLRMTSGCVLLAGCHHAKPRVAVQAIPAPPATGPVMVSVPPPTHRSEPFDLAVADGAAIPVVKPVKPPKKAVRRQTPAPAPVTTQVAAPPVQVTATTPVPLPATTLGQLTAGGDNAFAVRDQSAQIMRTQRDRVSGLSSNMQAAHVPELEQVRRFLKSAGDSWNAADYTGALALATKAKVLLDDLLQ